jgi:hypothetical protein
MHGHDPGDFLTAVLVNNLRLAVSCADSKITYILPYIVSEVDLKVPAVAQGSYAAVTEWCDNIAGRQSLYAEAKAQEYTMRVLRDEHKRMIDRDSVLF